MVEELRAGEERLRLFIEHAPAAMVMLDREMRYLAVSERWMKEFGPTGNITGRNHYEVFPEIRQPGERPMRDALLARPRSSQPTSSSARTARHSG